MILAIIAIIEIGWLCITAILRGFDGIIVALIMVTTTTIPYSIGLWIMSKTRWKQL